MGLAVAKTSFTFNFKKIPGAFLIALLVIIMLSGVELFMLPINFFTYRVWEALARKTSLVSGNFYPNMKITRVETGAAGFYTKYAVKKNVEWETDRYGNRKKDTGINRYPVVIWGDSNIAGSSLTQQDIISEVLEQKMKISVYPFTGNMDFLITKRFIDIPPDIVILGTIERNIPNLKCSKSDAGNQGKFSRLIEHLKSFRDNHQNLAIVAFDRIYKNNMICYLVGRIDYIIKYPFYRLSNQEWLPSNTVQSTLDKTMLFVKETVDKMASGKDISLEEIDRIVDTITCYAQICRDRGSRFIFLPIPDKENIYYKYVPIKNIAKPRFLERLILKLQNAGIEVIDTQKAFDEACRQNDNLLYHTDDAHWNAAGVKVAADLVERILNKGPAVK